VSTNAVVGFCLDARYKWDCGKRVLVRNGARGFLAKSTDLEPSVKPFPSIVVADMQNHFFQIPVLPQILNRDLFEQPQHRVLGPTALYQAQYQMSDLPCKCSLVSGGAHVLLAHWLVCVIFSATKLEDIWSFLRNPCIWKCSLNLSSSRFNWVLSNQLLLRLSRHKPDYASRMCFSIQMCLNSWCACVAHILKCILIWSGKICRVWS